MKNPLSKNIRVLGLAPSSYGCGFAVIEGEHRLVGWGVKTVKGGDKNARCLSKVGNLIAHFQPHVIAIEDARIKSSRRSPRIRALIEEIVMMASDENIKVKRYSRKQLKLGFLSDENGTKHALAQNLVTRFTKELTLRLPPKPKAWDNEDSRMDIFDAVALAEHFLRGGELNHGQGQY